MPTNSTELVSAQRELGGRIVRFLTNLKKSGKESLSLSLLKRRQKLLEEYWTEFSHRHRELVLLADRKDPYFSADYFSEVEDEYLDQGAVIDEWISSMLASAVDIPASSKPSPAIQDPEPALPQINLPTFSGDLFQWEGFRDQFCSLIHNSTRISKVRKLQYLKSCLAGEAAKMLLLTPVTESNYDGAWASLERRFGNRRILSASHMRRLINVSHATKASQSEIRRLLDEFRQTQEAFKALGKPVKEWDEWFVFLLTEKLDQTTRLAWEVSLTDPLEIPQFAVLETFLENRVHALSSARQFELPAASKVPSVCRGSPHAPTRTAMTVNVNEAKRKQKSGRQCPLCSGTHTLGACKRFKGLPSNERRAFVTKSGVCISCLATGHQVQNCTSNFRCWVCDGLHHTTLHDACSHTSNDTIGETKSTPSTSTCSATYTVSSHRVTLLATAQVLLEAPDGRRLTVRALLDSGSECSFLSEWAAQSLRLRRRPVRVNLTGYQGASVGTARSEVQVTIRSPLDECFRLQLDALVTKSLTAPTPSQPLETKEWPHIKGLTLADPTYTVPGRVDVLLGADVCGRLFQDKREGPPGAPVAILTPFGWTLLGLADGSGSSRSARILHVQREATPINLQRFWELEEVPLTTPMTPEELKCERLFQDTTFRDKCGRYVVRLPFRDTATKVGTSRTPALRILLSAERKRERDPNLRQQYAHFMEEYQRLGHMTAVTKPLAEDDTGFYLPHHAVWKDANGVQKIRVVFNASCAAAGGTSLNDALLPGPKLQSDLWAVITRWRLFRIAFSADIVKMFRQILVHPDDRDWLRILWRNDPSERVTDFRLNTVTYGTAPAPYLAHRVLKQLADDDESAFPLAAPVLRTNAYVDDILAGADNVEEAWQIRRELTDLLHSAGFPLDKWASSDPRLSSPSVKAKTFQEPEVHGALGLRWDTTKDSLAVRGPRNFEESTRTTWTKRLVLSEIARLFDPLGWLAPVFIRAKVLLQDLWLAGVSWDETISESITYRWTTFRREIPELDEISVPRWLQYSPGGCEVELHGFFDASERAYSAAVYLVVRRASGSTASLLMAKTRVAPTKMLSIPRLELCGAVLLARLLAALQKGLGLSNCRIHTWSDSTVVLAWLQSHPSKWKPFVAHRVAEILNLVSGASWRHVSTHENPADLATRGISSKELQQSTLWWTGPAWLTRDPEHWPASGSWSALDRVPEERQTTVLLSRTSGEENPYLARFSSLDRLIRVTAQIRRFAARCRTTGVERTEFLTTTELREALLITIRLSQRESYTSELQKLSRNSAIPATSPLIALRPFLGPDGILRVGGRLQNSTLGEARRHPAILHRASHLTILAIRDAHQKTLHGGVNATLAWVHRAFWIPRGRARVKQILHECVVCTRMKARTGHQQMGNLPAARVQPTKPFLRTGVDYAGPFALRTAKGRGYKSQKGYVVVFVCMVTKAVHLDAVTDLTSSAFLAAFHRFTARRGHCSQLYSDNATTFQGARGLLQRMFRDTSDFYGATAGTLANEGTEWSFIPPYSPHMGGLWEAAVKSMKTHLKRVIGEATLTYEEMTTLLCRIEACLNSRPLTALSDDPQDLEPLTPGHFLIEDRIRSPPEPPIDNSNIPLTVRWKLLLNMHEHFWRRWSQEYTHALQQRVKWPGKQENLRPGRLVLVKNDLTPATRWPLARVETLHPGTDGLVRVVTLRQGPRTFDRTVAKWVPLPVHDDQNPA